MRTVILLFCFTACFQASNAQRTFTTDNATIKFVSSRNSDVSAVNNKVIAAINEDGSLSFELLIRDFKFAMAEMEEHFNKNYMESDKYPNASFKGRIFDFKKVKLTKPGSYKVSAEGEMTIHNVTKKIMISGTLQVDKETVYLQSKLTIDIDDYKVDTGLGGMIIGSKMEVEVAAKCR